MTIKLKALALCMAISTLALTACNDDDSRVNPASSVATKTITVTPSLGKITKGRVVLKNLAGQSITDIKDITDNGTATFIVDTSKLNDPIIAEVLPAMDGKLEYADEAVTVNLVSISAAANSPLLRAATTITATNTNIGVTALTEAALNYAQSLSAQLTKSNIDTANQKIKDQLKLTKFNITDAPAVIGLNDFSPLINSALAEQQRAYAAYLATLAKESKRLNATSTQPAYDMLKAFSKDFSDGTFDAKQGQTALTDYSASFINAWSNWITVFYDSIFKLQNAGDLSAWLTAFNAQNPNIPTPSNPTPNPTTDTCASKKLPSTALSTIADYSGDYKDQGAVVFNLITNTAKATVKGTTADIKEVCGPNPQGNGVNHVLITDKGNITLFKTTTGIYSAEGLEFADRTKVFYGEKAAPISSGLCESNGADDKLGFKNAPQDFCSFSKVSSVVITSPNIYTFFNADKTQNTKVTVENNVIRSVQIEDNKYAWACGVGTLAACTGVTFDQRNANFIQFPFSNTVLSPVNGTQQPLTLKNGLLIHLGGIINISTTLAGGMATGSVKNVQLNKNGTATGGAGEFRTTEYDFKGRLDGQFSIGLYDTRQYLRYELSGQNFKFNSIKLYSLTNTSSPLFVYECHTKTRCGDMVTLMQGATSTLKFNDILLNGVYQPQFDAVINGEVKLNP